MKTSHALSRAGEGESRKPPFEMMLRDGRRAIFYCAPAASADQDTRLASRWIFSTIARTPLDRFEVT